MHHLILGKDRRVCVYSIVHLCRKHHRDNKKGCHGYGEGRKLQDMFLEALEMKYYEEKFTEGQVLYLMNRTDNCDRTLMEEAC